MLSEKVQSQKKNTVGFQVHETQRRVTRTETEGRTVHVRGWLMPLLHFNFVSLIFTPLQLWLTCQHSGLKLCDPAWSLDRENHETFHHIYSWFCGFLWSHSRCYARHLGLLQESWSMGENGSGFPWLQDPVLLFYFPFSLPQAGVGLWRLSRVGAVGQRATLLWKQTLVVFVKTHQFSFQFF